MKINRDNEATLSHARVLELFDYNPISGVILWRVRPFPDTDMTR